MGHIYRIHSPHIQGLYRSWTPRQGRRGGRFMGSLSPFGNWAAHYGRSAGPQQLVWNCAPQDGAQRSLLPRWRSRYVHCYPNDISLTTKNPSYDQYSERTSTPSCHRHLWKWVAPIHIFGLYLWRPYRRRLLAFAFGRGWRVSVTLFDQMQTTHGCL